MKVLLSGLAVGVGLALCSSAHAADIDELLAPHHQKFESAQNFAIELRLGQYVPGIDSDPNLKRATPYASTFTNTPRFLPGFEFDWQAIRIDHFGSIGPGIGASWTKMSAVALIRATGLPSAETTSLNVLPVYALAVVRVDALWRDLKVPLVPYAKLGVGMGLWWAGNSVQGISESDIGGQARKAEGKTFGYQAAVGAAFNLNSLDPLTAKNMDTATGVNNTYLFGELTDIGLTGFGDPRAMRLNDLTWTAGLAFEF